MSGYDSIMDWADEHYPMSDYDTFDQWFDAMSQDFNQEGRLPLEEIFDDSDIIAAKELFDSVKSREILSEERDSELQREIDQITESEIQPVTEPHIVEDIIEELVKPSDIIPNIKFAAKFGGFLRKLFRI